jgi:AcrR family transcriptional regulator
MTRRRTNDPKGLQRRLVDAAFEAFTAQGYNASAMHDVRRRAQVTGGALAHHFPTKKALGLAVLTQRVAEEVEALWISPLASAPSTAEGVRQIFAAIIAQLREQGRVRGCPLNNLALEISASDDDMRGAADAIFARWRSALADTIRADQQAGRVRLLDPEAAATFIIATYSGAMTMAKASQGTAPLEACAGQLAAYLADG